MAPYPIECHSFSALAQFIYFAVDHNSDHQIFIQWTKSSRSIRLFQMRLWFWCHFIHNAQAHGYVRVHSKNMSQDVFMALLLYSMTGKKENICVEAATATNIFLLLRNLTWISVEIYMLFTSDIQLTLSMTILMMIEVVGFYANKGYHIHKKTK